MNKTILVCILGLIAVYGCDNQSRQLEKAAEVCDVAIRIGDLEIAEEFCQKALGDVNARILTPEIKSERLYKLARIKRQRGKYPEAETLIAQSLNIEASLSNRKSIVVKQRLIERSLIFAGQKKWPEGAKTLQRVLSNNHDFLEKERKTIANILNIYARKLKQMDQTDLAFEFEEKARDMNKQVNF